MVRAARDPLLLTRDKGTPESQKPLRKIDLAQRTYDEVLDATKHQDDKVGRFLTAIAFLTTGAIALVATGAGLSRTFQVPDGDAYPLLAWATGGFFAATLAAVVLLLLCLSVPVRLPRASDDPMSRSHLFYSYIAARPRDDWVSYWKSVEPEKLESDMAMDYAREAHNLAERVSAKYRHSYEASWLFVCALLFLGVSIYLKVLTRFHGADAVPIVLETRHLIGLGLIASFHAALQIYTRAVHDIRSMEKARDHARAGDATEPPSKSFVRNGAMYGQRRWTFTLVLPTTAFSVLLALPVEDMHCGLAAVVAAVFAATLLPLLLMRPVWNNKKKVQLRRKDLRSWTPAFGIASLAAGFAWAALSQGGMLRVFAIVSPPLLMSVLNALRPARAHWVARQRERKGEVETLAA